MAIEESKISDLIEAYEGYQEDYASLHGAVARGREALYKTVIADLKKLLPRKTLADLGVDDYGKLTGTVVEYEGGRGVVLGGDDELTIVFTFSGMYAHWLDPKFVFPEDGERVWDENGVLLF